MIPRLGQWNNEWMKIIVNDKEWNNSNGRVGKRMVGLNQPLLVIYREKEKNRCLSVAVIGKYFSFEHFFLINSWNYIPYLYTWNIRDIRFTNQMSYWPVAMIHLIRTSIFYTISLTSRYVIISYALNLIELVGTWHFTYKIISSKSIVSCLRKHFYIWYIC